MGQAAVEQPNDVRVVEAGENLALADEAMLGLGPREWPVAILIATS